MTQFALEGIGAALVSEGKGILAADETVPTLTKRFAEHDIASTPSSRRDFRALMLTTPGVAQALSGVILHDETLRQQSADGVPITSLCDRLGILPGIKVDLGAKPLASTNGERVTEGLDGLRDRLAEYRELGARFAKWRAVLDVGEGRPSARCVSANVHALARYAALCQEQGVLPIVEPEVLMYGQHGIERCEEVTGRVLQAVFAALFEQGVILEGILLKPNMVLSGRDCPRQAPVPEVAAATLRSLRRYVPAAVAGVVFLSGGQNDVLATRHLDAINRAEGPKPWKLSFSYGRALQDAALATWRGSPDNVDAAQRVFRRRARFNGLAAMGAYAGEEDAPGWGAAAAAAPPAWRDGRRARPGSPAQ
jgi:fructose-bisphosphate aldolase class I